MIIASWLGLPVSSTHIAVGAVFGVGFFREWYTSKSSRRREYVKSTAAKRNKIKDKPSSADTPLQDSGTTKEDWSKRRLVRRAHVTTIVAAWVITVPAAAVLAGLVFMVLTAFG